MLVEATTVPQRDASDTFLPEGYRVFMIHEDDGKRDEPVLVMIAYRKAA
jgi:hypothetical protein